MRRYYKNNIIIPVTIIALIIIIGTLVFYGFEGNPKAMPAEEAQAMTMPAEEGENVFMENFRTIDIYGNEVGNEVFADYRLTMVYVWGTF